MTDYGHSILCSYIRLEMAIITILMCCRLEFTPDSRYTCYCSNAMLNETCAVKDPRATSYAIP